MPEASGRHCLMIWVGIRNLPQSGNPVIYCPDYRVDSLEFPLMSLSKGAGKTTRACNRSGMVTKTL